MSRFVEAREKVVYGPLNAILDPKGTLKGALIRAVGLVHGDPKEGVVRVQPRKETITIPAPVEPNLDSLTKRIPPQDL